MTSMDTSCKALRPVTGIEGGQSVVDGNGEEEKRKFIQFLRWLTPRLWSTVRSVVAGGERVPIAPVTPPSQDIAPLLGFIGPPITRAQNASLLRSPSTLTAAQGTDNPMNAIVLNPGLGTFHLKDGYQNVQKLIELDGNCSETVFGRLQPQASQDRHCSSSGGIAEPQRDNLAKRFLVPGLGPCQPSGGCRYQATGRGPKKKGELS
ncbi:hypothetical protein C8F04DRAFT_1315282 [Mycena alexandri]|uniref:Uncharacterized protein n=1 Tax=Mycena alexandri TaxID=1745969 RepID=A0AAD6X989_9AGAR|nr:hypothetical protein C8F04DRAFT_1315282 [Mycena alexandri]